jgi:rhodanese-related sulfurtransferase
MDRQPQANDYRLHDGRQSHNGAAWAVKLGDKNVFRYPGDIFAWKGAGNPVEKTK